MFGPTDPKLCKYTVEGTLVHEIMNNVKLLERREKTMYDGLEYKLTDKEKKEIIANSAAFLTAQNNKVALQSSPSVKMLLVSSLFCDVCHLRIACIPP